MVGIPKQFNTRDDIETCVVAANEGELDKSALKTALSVLLGDKTIRQVKTANVAADYTPLADETITEERDMISGEIIRNVLIDAENMHSRLRLVLEMTPDELTTIIGGL